MKKNIPWIIRVIVAVLFLFSALAKLFPSMTTGLETFIGKQLLPMGFSDTMGHYFSRGLIAAEFAIGIALLQAHFLKRFVVPVAILLLFVFCVQLSVDIFNHGPNASNCGCMGELIPMTPLQALIKNILAIGLLVYLYKLLPKDAPRQRFANLLVMFLSAALFLFAAAPIQQSRLTSNTNMDVAFDPTNMGNENPIKPSKTGDNNNLKPDTLKINQPGKIVPKDTKLNDPAIKVPEKPKGPENVVSKFSSYTNYIPSSFKIDDGKKILCLFAPGCEHCRSVAKQLTEMSAKNKDFPPIHVIFMDEEPEAIPDFFKFAGKSYPYAVAGVLDFWKILGSTRDTPGVVYLWNGNIRYFSDGIAEKEFNKDAFKQEIAKEK